MIIIKPKHYYLVGIGGISMSGIAAILVERGFRVSGSDSAESEITKKLERKGIRVYIGHAKDNLAEEGKIDFVVYSSAVSPNNVELREARKRNIPIIKRSELIGQLMEEKFGIAVSGMHGKTTVTAMAAKVLGDLDPTVLVGAEIKEFGNNNYRIGKSKYFVAEACEYYKAFLDFRPKIAVITSIEAEHLDYYRTVSNIKDAFEKFVNNLPSDGVLIACTDYPYVQSLVKKSRSKVITYGTLESKNLGNHFKVFNIIEKRGSTIFDVRTGNKIIKGIKLKVPGRHNVLNATAALIIGISLGVNIQTIKNKLAQFETADRRFEIKAKIEKITVISDYAHHPTEIKATLEGAKKFFPRSKIICVFQPHQYKRTRELFTEFSKSFKDANLTIIPDIYKVAGRDSEVDVKAVSAEKLVEKIEKNGSRAKFIDGQDRTVKFLLKNLRKKNVLIVMGAGDIEKIVPKVIDGLRFKKKYKPLIELLGKNVHQHELLSSYTTFKIGGPADLFFEAKKIPELVKAIAEAQKHKIPYFILGLGGNVLVSDKGFSGLIIKNSCNKIKFEGSQVIAEGGALPSDIVEKAAKKGLGGLEFFATFPATVGGAIYGNAGNPVDPIGNHLIVAKILGNDGKIKEVTADYFKFAYRESILKKTKELLLEATLQLQPKPKKEIEHDILDLKTKRMYPPSPSAGSIFKNPLEATAGQLLEKIGSKGMRIGDAEVWDKHANIILNKGNASAADVKELVKKLKTQVFRKFSVKLKEEIQYIGD